MLTRSTRDIYRNCPAMMARIQLSAASLSVPMETPTKKPVMAPSEESRLNTIAAYHVIPVWRRMT